MDAGRERNVAYRVGDLHVLERVAVPNEHPAAVVGARIDGGQGSGAVARGRLRGRQERELAARPSGRVVAERTRPVGQARDDAALVDGEPGAAGGEIPAADDFRI